MRKVEIKKYILHIKSVKALIKERDDHMEKRLLAPKTMGIIFLVITMLGVVSSTLTLLFSEHKESTLFFVLNYIGDFITLIGSIMLILGKMKAKLFIYTGSVLFGAAGAISLNYSIAGGLITICFAVLFISLTKKIDI